ncbi:MAG: phage portal protein [Sedimentisphaerales bacterium]|nr:phage portal protein [Sedimentisphaerales bacterium]
MEFDLDIFKDNQLQADYVDWLVDERSPDVCQHFSKLWDYYNNPTYDSSGTAMSNSKFSESGQCYFQAQEYGLPVRITGMVRQPNGGVFSGKNVGDIQRKEVVIENDIAWRINAAVDFLFGKPISFVCKSPDSQKSAEIESILRVLFSANGGIGFFQDMAVLGSVYGFVDCIVRPGEKITQHISSFQTPPFSAALQLAQAIDLELIEAPRALPVLDENDYRKIRYYVQHFYQKKNEVESKGSFLTRLFSVAPRAIGAGAGRNADKRRAVAVTEIISPEAWQRYENKQLVAEGELAWDLLPVVHIQNIAQPYYYEGASDVESLIPLQDELNTRLSDRASRITFQSFKMYLGKGIEGFEDRPVSPGRMWHTDNPDASIEEFGGDSATPSEDLHIAEIREAIDKTSGVTPIVAGVLKNKLGHLTSAVALRLTLMGMLFQDRT